jgi:hypothetical protein
MPVVDPRIAGKPVPRISKETMEREFERLPYEPLYEEILDVPVRKAVITAAGMANQAYRKGFQNPGSFETLL